MTRLVFLPLYEKGNCVFYLSERSLDGAFLNELILLSNIKLLRSYS